MPLITAADARAFTAHGVKVTGLASPSRGAAESAVWIVVIEGGTPGTTHRVTREEIFVALEGRAVAALAGKEYELEAGSAFIVPPETDFCLSNPHDVAFRAVAVLPVGGEARLGDRTFVPPWAE